ncbi:MAG: penicillin-binding protein activator [Nitrosomonadales bacterium]|nr:penicillin-binding protein activator [Nitrosomonadales bacterium]
MSLTAHATNAPVSPAEKSAPHIALLLPLKSTALGQAAEAVRQGFFAAAGTQPQALPVRVYAASSESLDNIIWLYRQAIANGARAVVGPLTRNGVAALADYPDIAVPTLALNMADALDADKLYFFGLPAEAEARQVARLAAQEKLRTAIIISNGTPLSRRLTQAFAEEWKALGGTIISELLYNDDPTALASLPTAMGNMIFLAADAEKARLIRPYLDSALPVYATSQLFNGNTDTLTNYDLKDVNFVDMPWLLQSDHPAVMIYPRANPPLTPDMERLYALGIDAYRLLQVMLSNHLRTALPLDGVTGRISLHDDHHFQRVAIPAIFKQGLGLTPEEAAALAAAQAAALAATRAAAASGVPPAAVPAQ